MSRRDTVPATPAIRSLRQHGVSFVAHPYAYEDHGGTRVAAAALGLDEHAVIKTLVMDTDSAGAVLVLMHGDREVSTKALARELGVKRVAPCDPADAERLTGYRVGGISPFGTRRQLPVLVEGSVLALERIAINGGARGLLVEIVPAVLLALLDARTVHVSTPH